MPETDLDLLIRAAHAAGQVALRFADGPLNIVHKDDGEGPVTDADHAVNDTLQDLLRSARPDYGWLSEESPDDPDRLTREAVFVLDPIDGTRSFIEGARTWAHSLAIVRGGQVTAGAVLLPRLDRLYAAAKGQGATLNGSPIRVARARPLAQAQVLATKPSLDPVHWQGGRVPSLNRHHRPSLAYRLSLVAEGRFDAMFTFRPSWEWDIAAGALILSEAGAVVTDRTGAALVFNNAVPQTKGVVAAPDALHHQIMQTLTKAPLA